MDKLLAKPLLGGLKKEIGGTVLSEVTNTTLLALALPNGKEAAAKTAIKTHFGATYPTPTKSSQSKDKKIRLVSTQADQAFAIIEGRVKSTKTLGAKTYITDITDGWIQLRLSGPKAAEALERLSKVDLRMPIGGTARTDLEHMGAVIVKEAADQFLLLSMSSSAKSFAHALDVSLENVS
ncbi:MAG: hypothetical protein AAF429_14735 [Pseudomonadota bacterium]